MKELLDLDVSSVLTSGELMQLPSGMLISLVVTMVLSAILYTTYRFSYTSLNYNKKFNITLVMIAFISTILMSLIKSNVALSLGMLGSLSIARFRTNVKDPRDIGFIFWSLSIGIACAMGGYMVSFVGSIIMAVFMVLSSKTLGNKNSLLLVIRGQDTDIELIEDVIDNSNGKSRIKAKNILSDSFELVYEINVPKRQENIIINNLLDLKGIDTVNILAPNTEVA